MFQIAIKIIHKVSFYLCALSAISMFFVMLLTVGDVTGRSFFDRPITGTYELSQYFLVVIVLMGVAYAQQSGQHVAIDYFIGKLGRRVKLFFDYLGTILGTIFFALVTWQGWIGGLNAIKAKTVSDTLYIPSYPFEFLIAVGSFFLCLELLGKLFTLSHISYVKTTTEASVGVEGKEKV